MTTADDLNQQQLDKIKALKATQGTGTPVTVSGHVPSFLSRIASLGSVAWGVGGLVVGVITNMLSTGTFSIPTTPLGWLQLALTVALAVVGKASTPGKTVAVTPRV